MWRFMGFIIFCLLVAGGVSHQRPGYFVAVLLVCGVIGMVGSTIMFFARHR